ncbi:hypothetical protein [Sphingomonas sp.]|uniref:hypothetical protein n=1 Tax=Sphingomonas sp. TaxID=28214 RepID=UPI0025EFB812|nr:hypothetical protein [Sphingomonas sp.]MBV9527065.1 hypothetical protein [Sphingomonas sp.]
MFVILMGVGVAASPALAQSTGDVTLFSKGNFRGGGMVLSGPREKMDPVHVESLQLPPGSAWELCSGRTFTGCKQFSQSRKSMVMTIRSARPVEGAIPESASASVGAAGEGGLRGSGASLRGLASEFFVMPDEGGNRVEVSGTAGALSQRATDFCRAHGWRQSPYQRVQSVGGRSYLADVLCTNADR